MSNDFNEAASNLSAKQAAAVNTYGDRVQFNGVRILGNQDTLLVNTSCTLVPRLSVRNPYIGGDVDFIFGGGTAGFPERRRGGGRAHPRRSVGGYVWLLVAGCQVRGHRDRCESERQPSADERGRGGSGHAECVPGRLGRLEPHLLGGPTSGGVWRAALSPPRGRSAARAPGSRPRPAVRPVVARPRSGPAHRARRHRRHRSRAAVARSSGVGGFAPSS